MPIFVVVKNGLCAAAKTPRMDWEQVGLLVGDKDVLPDEIRDIYRDFSLEATNRLREFRDFIPSIDSGAIRQSAHYLKTAAFSFGFCDFGKRLEKLEAFRFVPTEKEWDAIVSRLSLSLKESMTELTRRHPAIRKTETVRRR